ncbi:hypothetical protein [Saccharomonospora cyanea]|uniref:hypothetical protein n=1 Tax=Saccharomonospora cyanea TaxID=40989 RepID=UPI0005B85184|nr:hypothetical protein [Saccharomonospora cyanea]
MRQNRARRLTALVSGLLAASLLMTGCGDTEPSAAGPVAETRTMTLHPFTDEGEPAAGLRVIQKVSARCAPSMLSPENERARRCFTNETSVAMDPCFVPDRPVVERDPDNEAARELGMKTVALCVSDPRQTDVTKVYVVEETPTIEPEPSLLDPHWSLELADGTHCVKALGVPEIREGRHLSYSCDDGGSLYGLLDETRKAWRIHHRAEGSEGLTVSEVRTAWR